MNIDFKSLGFTQEELLDRLVERIAEMVMSARKFYENEGEYETPSKFSELLKERVKSRIDSKVDELAEKFVLPNISEYIENLTIQKTNEYGEKKGEPATFIEYLVNRAEKYMQEYVDHNGKPIEKRYCTNSDQTRITYLVDKYLHMDIENSMKDSLKIALGEIAKGIHETARLKLNEISQSMKISINMK